LVWGNKVLSDPASLAVAGTSAFSIAADGFARLVLRLGAATAGEHFTVTLYDSCCENIPSNPAESGTLADINTQDSPVQQLSVTSVDTDIGPMAFAVYRAPLNFSRNGQDDNAALRMVHIHAATNSGPDGTDMILYIVRPPVVLVHGLWGSRDDWRPFTPLINDPLRQFIVEYANYDYRLGTSITATIPDYGADVIRNIRGNALGFAFAAPPVLEQINSALAVFRQKNSAAVAQADVIAHSMGGTVARTLINLPRFVGWDNYGAGFIHKLITIGTPHFGSPLASDMLNDANACFRNLLAKSAHAALSSVVIDGTSDVHGGARDLSPNSAALTSMQQGDGPTVPTAMVGAITTAANTASLDNVLSGATVVRLTCSSDPVVSRFTAQGWRTEFNNEDNDGIVALSSQLNGSGTANVVGVIHSSGIAGRGALGFTGPAEQESGDIQAWMITLLNEAVTGTHFQQLR
jgi:pimeloyl-ACP methyl ester carboxylesterase